MDDFFLRPEQRTVERYKQIGGNIDYERFKKEVLQKIRRKEPICYYKFDCSTMSLLKEAVLEKVRKFIVIEGSYSMHPYFHPELYSFSIFL